MKIVGIVSKNVMIMKLQKKLVKVIYAAQKIVLIAMILKSNAQSVKIILKKFQFKVEQNASVFQRMAMLL